MPAVLRPSPPVEVLQIVPITRPRLRHCLRVSGLIRLRTTPLSPHHQTFRPVNIRQATSSRHRPLRLILSTITVATINSNLAVRTRTLEPMARISEQTSTPSNLRLREFTEESNLQLTL